jgi:hypothetical protein
MPQTPATMFADEHYEGWDKLSAYEKVERMMEIHKKSHEGEEVSLTLCDIYLQIIFVSKFEQT